MVGSAGSLEIQAGTGHTSVSAKPIMETGTAATEESSWKAQRQGNNPTCACDSKWCPLSLITGTQPSGLATYS